MVSPERFEALSAGLAEGVRARDGLIGLVLLGSASDEASARRDEWSDHDFFAIVEDGRGAQVRPDLSWLPDREHIVLTAREGEIGFVAVYDDGHVFEFAFSEAGELAGAAAGDATVVVDDERGTTTELIERARARADAADRFDPANDARLVLVKLLIGVGRVRRGEVLNGGQLIRQWAVQHLVRAIRGRFAAASGPLRDTIDPVRRFERDFPEWGVRITAALERPAEEAARELFAFTREVLEPGWDDFPSRAADAVAKRLRWEKLSTGY
ncbi:hypothetical protein [Microbacterium immunditiarum]|uniref:Uncharacterized protein n=1 Tax=Microbacterium immunditiarum TaxID=337480 RepID=A0A7Y9GMH0_9MICO|nr:hypothetical protein [Microbacterium immunditiarum]NYE19217.1 hypothetical protein [Microbacterium immunditiarum]